MAWGPVLDVETLRRELSAPDLVVLDCRFRLAQPEAGARLYDEGHIPGSQYAHLDRDLSGPRTPDSGRHPLPHPADWRKTASRWGIGHGTRVAAYDDAGGAVASRAWWLLRHYGHGMVAVLDGGFPVWTRAGGPVTRDAPTVKATRFQGEPGHMPIVDAARIMARFPLAPGTLLDARDAERFRGEVEPIDAVAGHIPGAFSAPYQENLAPDGRFLAPLELQGRYAKILAGRPPTSTAVYCGSGVTSTQLLLTMESAGLQGAALYPGSWSEWIRDPLRPVARGG